MRVSDNKYICDWCDRHIVKKVNNGSQLVCPDCNRYVSQKTKFELENK